MSSMLIAWYNSKPSWSFYSDQHRLKSFAHKAPSRNTLVPRENGFLLLRVKENRCHLVQGTLIYSPWLLRRSLALSLCLPLEKFHHKLLHIKTPYLNLNLTKRSKFLKQLNFKQNIIVNFIKLKKFYLFVWEILA